MTKIRGLDAIRFVCALWVVFGHYGVPVAYGNHGSLLNTALAICLHNLFFGPPAVVIFFVISGFCIHFPFHSGSNPSWFEYYLRRYIRIGIPLLAAKVFVHFAGPDQSHLEDAVLWSLYAEIIYYSIYPLLRWASLRFGWRPILIASIALSTILVLTHPTVWTVQLFGVKSAWLVGLPCWLLGCVLAENVGAIESIRTSHMLRWRVSVFLISVVCGVLEFHTPVFYPYTTTLFGILVYYWLAKEMAYARVHAPWKFLESAGRWSYSLYLCHHPAQYLYSLLPLHIKSAWLDWLARIVFALAISYLFFLAVERPSHWLARQAKLERRKGALPVDIGAQSAIVSEAKDPPSHAGSVLPNE